ncbi:MAG: hypothetical protein Tp172DCM1112201_32 [Prokaryotic dsDNA virus sp.]|nr:MAG: hypothetical protein Tp172DCM1112201_32 [Prokaryotic dsDNA virus sp.]|tara:strand:+ start:1471 stop:1728 length:258 start_codon:yes stop_codon:yes gene_type:complete
MELTNKMSTSSKKKTEKKNDAVGHKDNNIEKVNTIVYAPKGPPEKPGAQMPQHPKAPSQPPKKPGAQLERIPKGSKWYKAKKAKK